MSNVFFFLRKPHFQLWMSAKGKAQFAFILLVAKNKRMDLTHVIVLLVIRWREKEMRELVKVHVQHKLYWFLVQFAFSIVCYSLSYISIEKNSGKSKLNQKPN